MDINIADKLFPNIASVVVQLISTGVMFFFFKKFLWKPMQDYFAKRADFIESTMNDATKLQSEAKTLMEESEKQARDAAIQYRSIVEQAKEDASTIKNNMIVEANEEAKQKLERATKEIENEKLAAKEAMKEEIVNVAIEVATKVMNKQMDEKTNEALVKDFVDEVVN